ncbi:zinc finger protein 39-like [Corythoichthys intestinalis]|uniref:zinc finger protein 39-like n=1 Tax=Corythoichthys intestinalis TaxID=161448 RepID=UPI0025A5A20B|nr:zinc finger protein 39-like [Corythoichthys intestinalis]
MTYIKQETEPGTPYIKEEEQEEKITKCTGTINVKSEEDEGPSEASGAAKQSCDGSFQHLTTKGEGHSQPDDLLAPLSDSDNITSHSSDYNTDEEDVDFDQNAWKYVKKSSLKRDTKNCASEKPFGCTLCDKVFSRKTNLEAHKRTHAGEKPFPFACSLCEKRYYCQSQLTTHTRTHTGEKPFPCSFCKKRFYHKRTLNRHAEHTLKKSLLSANVVVKDSPKRLI